MNRGRAFALVLRHHAPRAIPDKQPPVRDSPMLTATRQEEGRRCDNVPSSLELACVSPHSSCNTEYALP
jgi:hypothetical protein